MCKSHYRRDYYQRNREKQLADAAAYWHANKDKITERTNARFRENPEPRRETVRKYKAANPEKIKAEAERFRKKYPERQAKWGAEWYQANRDRARKMQEEWRARAMGDPGWLEAERQRAREKAGRRRAQMRSTSSGRVDLSAILERDGMTCHLCLEPIPSLEVLHFDHVIPLSKGGPHSMDNIKPSHAACNLRKGAKLAA